VAPDPGGFRPSPDLVNRMQPALWSMGGQLRH